MSRYMCVCVRERYVLCVCNACVYAYNYTGKYTSMYQLAC